ncbi:MAG: fused MFS/spermidine synthase, partial [Candidatus Zixiibacteriota bacterium]
MIRKALLLGFFSTGGQVLLLRELVSSLNGDELFIGTALFGWLVAVAVGAWWGGRTKIKISAYPLFLIGTLVFWTALLAVRLCPRLVSDIPGEIIPFSVSVLISIILMTPVGVISGMLFSFITRESRDDAGRAVVSVYLFEGIGAFLGGVLIAFTAGNIFSSTTTALALGFIIIANSIYFLFNLKDKKNSLVTVAVTIFLIITIKNATPVIEKYLDEIKYPSYTVEKAFNTPYGHHALITENEIYTLITDNRVEAVYPDHQTVENLLLPPLIYNPEAADILLIGQAEFGPAQLAEKLMNIQLTALDPRHMLSEMISQYLPESNRLRRLYRDPIAYISDSSTDDRYDIIVLNVGEPDNHKNNIYFTSDFFKRVKRLLRPNGLLFIPTGYDTERYISDETARILAILYNSLKASFNQALLWPGNMTLGLASDRLDLNLPLDTIETRLEKLPFEGDYINTTYLSDRLEPMKLERLNEVLNMTSESNRLVQPLLPHYQALYDARKSGSDELIVAGLLNHPAWLYALPVAILLFFGFSLTGGYGRFGLMLYFTAGV